MRLQIFLRCIFCIYIAFAVEAGEFNMTAADDIVAAKQRWNALDTAVIYYLTNNLPLVSHL